MDATSGRTKLELGLAMMLARVAGTGWGGIQQFQCFFVRPSATGEPNNWRGRRAGLWRDVGVGMRMRKRRNAWVGSRQRRHSVRCVSVCNVRGVSVSESVRVVGESRRGEQEAMRARQE